MLNGLAGLRFNGCRAFVPKHTAWLIVANIAQSHGMRSCKFKPRKTFAELSGIVEAIGLLMARTARNAVIDAETFVVKQNAA